MLPPFATAHIITFCTSRDGPRNSDFLRTVPTKSKIFLGTLCKKKILARNAEVQNKNGGNNTFFRNSFFLQIEDCYYL